MVVFDMDKLMPEFPRKPRVVKKCVEVDIECPVVVDNGHCRISTVCEGNTLHEVIRPFNHHARTPSLLQ